MVMTKEEKQDIVKEFQQNPSDTSSAQVQVALITNKLKYLTEHFKKNKKDNHSRRGLLKMVGQRRRLLNYLGKKNNDAYKTLITKLGIRK